MYYSETWKILKQVKWCMDWKSWWRKFVIYWFYLFIPRPPPAPALSLATFYSFPSSKFAFPIALTLLLEVLYGHVFAVNRITEILHPLMHPLMHPPLFLDVCSRVAPWSVLWCSHTALSCRKGGNFFSHCYKTGKWDTSQEGKIWTSWASALLAVFYPIIES